jgi:ADP-heptose:LPS heptosyltransferase
MRYKGNETRRWPLANFIEVARRQLTLGRHVRFFIGPSEAEDEAVIRQVLGDAVEIVKTSLAAAAQRIDECAVMVANDAGLAHISAGLDVPTVVVFGMSDPVRATPVGPAFPVRPTSCTPCNDEGLRRFECALHIDFKCLREDVTVAHVCDSLERALRGEDHAQPVLSGAFSLFGQRHE